MSELRTRMIRDMTVRGFSPSTHEAYIGQVVKLARYYKRTTGIGSGLRSQSLGTGTCAW
jgi:hypothetical protein